MKFLIDEDLTPRLAQALHEHGFDATCLRDRGRLGLKDWEVRDLALGEERTIVTGNGDDYRALMGRESIHPGLIILPSAATLLALTCLDRALDHVQAQAHGEAPSDYLVNRVISVAEDGTITDVLVPPEE